MKKSLAIIAGIAILASCKKGDDTPVAHVPAPCATNHGSANLTFTSDFYNTTNTYNLDSCEVQLTYKYHHWNTALFKSTFVVETPEFAMGLNSLDSFVLGDSLMVGRDQLTIRTNVGGDEMYAYTSNGNPGSHFIATQITDSTISGTFRVYVSRRRTFNNGENLDSTDNSVVEGTFQGLKILSQQL